MPRLELEKNTFKFVCDDDIKLELLTSYKMDNGIYFDIRDFENFKNKLKQQGLSEIEVSDEAYAKIEELERDKKQIELLKMDRSPLEKPVLIKTQPYSDQLPAIRLLLNRQFVGNWDTMGAGKTFVSLFALASLYEKNLAKRTIVICPNAVKLSWSDAIQQHSLFKFKVISNGTERVIKELDLLNDEDIFIIHYDCFVQELIFNKLIEVPVDVVILDDAHFIKNLSAKRTRKILYYIQKVKRRVPLVDSDIRILNRQKPFVWCLTGTPVSENPGNAYVLLRLLDPDFKIEKWRFDNFYNIYTMIDVWLKKRHKKVSIKKIVGFKNVETLKTFFEPFSIRRSREELKGMPSVINSDKILTLLPEANEIYQKLRDGVIREIKVAKNIGLLQLENKLLRLQQFLNHPAILGFNVESVKHQVILDLLDELLPSGEQVIIWGIFRKGMELLDKTLKERDIKSYLVYGGVDNDELLRVKKDFEDKKIQVIIASIKKMGTGVDFLKQARTAIYLDMPFSFVEFVQSQDRLVRRGTSGFVNLIRLVVSHSVDELIIKILYKKTDLFRKIVDEKEEFDVDKILDWI